VTSECRRQRGCVSGSSLAAVAEAFTSSTGTSANPASFPSVRSSAAASASSSPSDRNREKRVGNFIGFSSCAGFRRASALVDFAEMASTPGKC
jgi:hypothetical protein